MIWSATQNPQHQNNQTKQHKPVEMIRGVHAREQQTKKEREEDSRVRHVGCRAEGGERANGAPVGRRALNPTKERLSLMYFAAKWTIYARASAD